MIFSTVVTSTLMSTELTGIESDLPLLQAGFRKEFCKFAFEKFAGRALRNVGDEVNGLGAFEIGEVQLAEVDDVPGID